MDIIHLIKYIIELMSNKKKVPKEKQEEKKENKIIEKKDEIIINKEKNIKISIDYSIRNKWYDKNNSKSWNNRRRDVSPKTIVIHGTAGFTRNYDLINWMATTGRPGYSNSVGLYHYAIGGRIKNEPKELVETLDPDYWSHHAHAGRKARYQIGIELINPSESNGVEYLDRQYELLFSLIFDYLVVRFPSIEEIYGHRYSIWKYTKEPIKYDKNCPGSKFDWDRLGSELIDRNYNIIKMGNPGKEGFKFKK